jgi:hypothetical protein
MTIITPNLGLTTYKTTIDASSVLVYDYVDQVSGSSTTQNLGIIDAFAGNTSASLILISASMVDVLTKLARTKSAEIQIVAPDTDVDDVSGIFYFRIPSEFNDMVLSRAQSFVNTPGTTGDTTIQVRNMTKYSGSDCLSSAISIESGDSVGTPGTIDTDYDDVSTDDQIKIYITAYSTTKPKGLLAVLEYVYP